MPGPMHGTPWNMGSEHFHSKCQKGGRCQGPGCRVFTGKTAIKRRKNGIIRKGRRRRAD